MNNSNQVTELDKVETLINELEAALEDVKNNPKNLKYLASTIRNEINNFRATR